MYKLAVFVSGRGSNLLSIYSQIKEGNIDAEICAVVSNKIDCRAIDFAVKENIPTYIVSSDKDRSNYRNYSELLEIFISQRIDLIILAGFLKKIPEDFIKGFKNKIINIHPALLPSFGGKGMYGINVHTAVFNSSAKVSGPTVHFVNEIYDDGKIIAQKAVDITHVKSPEEIAEKVLQAEHQLLPMVVKKFAENKIRITDTRIFID